MEYLINDNACLTVSLNDIENILYFRVKNFDRNIDLHLFNSLSKQIYNI